MSIRTERCEQRIHAAAAQPTTDQAELLRLVDDYIAAQRADLQRQIDTARRARADRTQGGVPVRVVSPTANESRADDGGGGQLTGDRSGCSVCFPWRVLYTVGLDTENSSARSVIE